MEVWRFRSKQFNLRFSYAIVQFSWWERYFIEKIIAKHPKIYCHPYLHNAWVVPTGVVINQKLLYQKPKKIIRKR